MSVMAPYSMAQTVFMLSLGSNGLFDITGETASLQANIDAFLGTPGGDTGSFFALVNQPDPEYPCLANAKGESGVSADWVTAWGPVVYQAPLNPGATNVMYVAHSPTMNAYVVGIAGTNPDGDGALLIQDLDVHPADMVAFPPDLGEKALSWTKSPDPSPTTAAIARGTANGLDHLYTMHDPKLGMLVDFLKTKADPSTTLYFTGHSLGGALSPMMALLLCPNGADGWAKVRILATAGPTPGTAAVAGMFATAYPQEPTGDVEPAGPAPFTAFTQWNTNYANAWDVVPRAWNALYGLVTEEPKGDDTWPSFFGGGTPIDAAAGKDLNDLLNLAQSDAGYAGGSSTPYYTPALPQIGFDGVWGSWTWTLAPGATAEVDAGQDGPWAYPSTWTPETVTSPIQNMNALIGYILDAHLSQYSYAFLGFSGPKNPPAIDNAIRETATAAA